MFYFVNESKNLGINSKSSLVQPDSLRSHINTLNTLISVMPKTGLKELQASTAEMGVHGYSTTVEL